MRFLVHLLIGLPQRIASYFTWSGPLLARLVVGYVFMLTGWSKLNHLDAMIRNFTNWGIPYPHILTPVASGIEFFGGIFLMVGLLTRISSGALAVVMVVAVISAKWEDIDSLETLLGFEEATYFAVFFWLAVVGAGKVSLDYLLERAYLPRHEASSLPA